MWLPRSWIVQSHCILVVAHMVEAIVKHLDCLRPHTKGIPVTDHALFAAGLLSIKRLRAEIWC
jgi:hypothetical protein